MRLMLCRAGLVLSTFTFKSLNIFKDFNIPSKIFYCVNNVRTILGVRGGLCNPSYWDGGIWGWLVDREPPKGSKWLAEGPHYTVEWSDTSVPGAVRTQTPRGADPIQILPRSGHQWCLNYSWCGVRLDHRRREAGLSCIPGLTLVSLLDRVEGCYKCQPLRLEAISHTRDAHFRNIRGRSNKQTNKKGYQRITQHSSIKDSGMHYQ